MLLFAEAGAGRLIDAQLDHPGDAPLVTAYGLENRVGKLDAVKAVVFNKHDDRAVKVKIDCGEKAAFARALRLTAPRLDDTQDVTLGGNPVGGAGLWTEQRAEDLPVNEGVATLHLPAGSAAVVRFSA
jgi:hypothetical protein